VLLLFLSASRGLGLLFPSASRGLGHLLFRSVSRGGSCAREEEGGRAGVKAACVSKGGGGTREQGRPGEHLFSCSSTVPALFYRACALSFLSRSRACAPFFPVRSHKSWHPGRLNRAEATLHWPRRRHIHPSRGAPDAQIRCSAPKRRFGDTPRTP
jgi:hypothetical protein